MIASLTGILAAKSPESVLLDVGGVGYEVFVPLSTYYQLPETQKELFLYIYTHLRDDALQLYGFLSLLEKKIFVLLMSVSGVGPRLARNILSGLDVADLLAALQKGETGRLRGIPGIGPKMAGRLVLELQEKATSIGIPSPAGIEEGGKNATRVVGSNGDGLQPSCGEGTAAAEDALSALINLGYPPRDAKRVIHQIRESAAAPTSVREWVKQALRALSKGG